MAERSYAEVVASAHAEERELVAVERHGDRAVMCLADPEKRNVLSAPLMVQLLAHAEELAHDETALSVEDLTELDALPAPVGERYKV
jgi:2-(1,2-epoxy-1,2-dihydrophenyl)acetyl-CoA isomerase